MGHRVMKGVRRDLGPLKQCAYGGDVNTALVQGVPIEGPLDDSYAAGAAKAMGKKARYAKTTVEGADQAWLITDAEIQGARAAALIVQGEDERVYNVTVLGPGRIDRFVREIGPLLFAE